MAFFVLRDKETHRENEREREREREMRETRERERERERRYVCGNVLGTEIIITEVIYQSFLTARQKNKNEKEQKIFAFPGALLVW